MSLDIFNGLTSQTVDLFIADTASTTGGGKTGLVFNTSGLSAWYRKGATGTLTQISLVTQTVGGAWSSGGFVEVDSTNAPGLYRLDIPNAAVDAAGFTTVTLKGTALVMAPVRIDCRPVNTVTTTTTTTNLTNLPSAPTDWLTAAAVKADAVNKIQAGLATSSQVTALNNLSSLANLFGPTTMEIPDSGSTVFKFTLTVKDQEGLAAALDASPTITVVNASGTSRAAGLSSVLNPATGEYTFTYTVASTDSAEALTFKAAGTVSSEARSAFWVSSVVDYNALTTIASIEALAQSIKTKTDQLTFTTANVVDASPTSASDIRTAVGLAFANLDAQLSAIDDYIDTEVAAIKTVTDKVNTALVLDGSVYQFTVNALENAPSSGGSTSVVVHPGYASWAEKVAGQELTVFHNEAGDLGPIRVQRRIGTTAIAEDVDLTELTGLYFLAVDYQLTEVYTTTSVTISGTENSQFTVPVTTELTGTVTNETKEEWHYWSLRDETDTVISTGRLRVRPA